MANVSLMGPEQVPMGLGDWRFPGNARFPLVPGDRIISVSLDMSSAQQAGVGRY